jgi:SRSO17 transposase
MSYRDRPNAIGSPADACRPADDPGLPRGVDEFLKRYRYAFKCEEQFGHAAAVVRGLLSSLPRKTAEHIARFAGVPLKNLQYFLGRGRWFPLLVMAEIRDHVRDELADPEAVLVVQTCVFPKKGRDSCGVSRQSPGRPGQAVNCQIGVFIAYVAQGGVAPMDCALYLPSTTVVTTSGKG